MPAPPTVTNSSIPPGAPADGDLWFNTTTGREYVWYTPPSGVAVWVQTQPSGGAYVPPTPQPVSVPHPPAVTPVDITRTPTITISPVAPGAPLGGDLWWSPTSGQQFVWYDDGTTAQWVISNWGAGKPGKDGEHGDPGPPGTPGIVQEIREGDDIVVSGLFDAPTVGVVPNTFARLPLPAPPTTLPPSGPAGGALNGTYPNPSLAVPYPTTLPPSGPAGGDLTGTYPNPTARSGLIPTTLPPSGPAGGDLAGTYPNPTARVGLIPTTLPPSGAAGGALAGTYPNPTLVGGPLSNYALTSALPTTLPPNGPAGGGLAGTYPNPTIKPSATNLQVLTTVGGVATWAAPSGGASISVGDAPPGSPTAGALWWNSVLGTLFIYYNDGNTTQWVPAAPSVTGPIVPLVPAARFEVTSNWVWGATTGLPIPFDQTIFNDSAGTFSATGGWNGGHRWTPGAGTWRISVQLGEFAGTAQSAAAMYLIKNATGAGAPAPFVGVWSGYLWQTINTVVGFTADVKLSASDTLQLQLNIGSGSNFSGLGSGYTFMSGSRINP